MSSSSRHTQTENDTVRISREMAAQSMLTDIELSDITLRGTDGTLILANRCLLAARSTVFRRMLLGPFSEATKSIIDIGYTGTVLRTIVEFIYIDHATLFDKPVDDKWIAAIVNVLDAGNYFGLPDLCDRTEQLVASKVTGDPFLAVALLVACQPVVSSTVSRLEALAFREISDDIHVLLERSSLRAISSTQLEKVLDNAKLQVDAYSMFRLIQMWDVCQDESELQDDSPCISKKTLNHIQSRHRTACQLIRDHVALDLIDPQILSTTVTSSGLVTDEQLSEAYKIQALLLQPHYGISLDQFRLRGIWESSNSAIFTCESDTYAMERLKCRETLTRGAYKWSIKILESCSPILLGFAVASTNGQRKRWLYGSNGRTRHSSRNGMHYHENGHPTFATGSIVTLCLDLTGDGTLTGSVDSKDPFLLFDDIRCDLIQQELPMDFVPVVYLKWPARVQFLGLDVISQMYEST